MNGPVIEGEWREETGWYVWRERTSKPFAHIRTEATRLLFRGLAAFLITHEWRGQVLYVSGPGLNGYMQTENGYLTARVRFDFWSPAAFVPFFKAKAMAEIAAATAEVAGSSYIGSKDVFIVHGHSEEARTQLKLLVRNLGLNPIVLADQSDGGMTIIEKFEYYANSCSFALALMTPDDTLPGPDGVSTVFRARPNVILEIGWFMARLGRTRVMLLSQGDLEVPSDLKGVLYLPFRDSVLEVAPELSGRLREAGLL
jgi:predicted nucleotide-binding protein